MVKAHSVATGRVTALLFEQRLLQKGPGLLPSLSTKDEGRARHGGARDEMDSSASLDCSAFDQAAPG